MFDLSTPAYSTIDSRTVLAHLNDLEGRNWLVTQTWAWAAQPGLPEGDALVVCCHTFSDPDRPAFVYLRLADKVHCLRASSLYQAMRSLDLNP